MNILLLKNLTADNFAARLKQANLASKNDIDGFVKNTDFDEKIKKLATKAKLKVEQDKTVKLQTFNSSYFCGKSHLEDHGARNYLVFQPIYRCFKKIGNSNHIWTWKSKELSHESIGYPTTSNNSLTPSLNHINTKIRVKFDGSYLKQEKLTFTHKK